MATLNAWRCLSQWGLVAGILLAGWGPVSAQRHSEYQVKAAFLQSFSKFVEWPAAADQREFGVCVLGDDPFGSALDDVAAGTSVRSHPVVVRRIRQIAATIDCQTLFIGASEAGRLSMVLEALRTSPILTISDIPQFAQRGGMIGFATEGGRVRFVANPEAAKTAGLHLSSDLLRVASAVVGLRLPQE